MAEAITTIHLIERGADPATLANHFLRSTQGSREALRRIVDRLQAAIHGAVSGKLIVRVDGSAGVTAAGTVAVTKADGTAGDSLGISFPGRPAYKITAKASGAVAASGEYNLNGAGDTEVAESLRDAINAVPGLKDLVIATAATGTVTITAREPGTWWNGTFLTKVLTTATHLVIVQPTGGKDPGDRAQATCTFGAANIANDDTIRIGSVLFTWKAAAANEDQITSDNAEATAAANFLAKVNAHSKLQGLVLASLDSAAVVRLTFLGDPRSGELVYLVRTETNAGSVTFSATSLGSGSTESYGAAPITHTLGAP